MQDHSISCSLLLFLLCYAALVKSYPVGINLGETYLTSAYYTEADELIPVASVVANEEWRSYFAKTWENPKGQAFLNDSETRLLLKNTLQKAKAATEIALNHTVIINSIVGPQHFSQTNSLTLLCEAAEEDGLISQWSQVTSGLNGARLAYNLDSCAGFRLKPGQKCDIEDGLHFSMIVNYGRQRFSVAMVDIGLYICAPYNIVHYEQFGETSGSILELAMKEGLSKDLKIYLATFEEDMRNELNVKGALEYLRAVVLSGEASKSGMDEMRRALTAALNFLPEYHAKLRTSLDPHFVGAFGAAQRARRIIQNPEFLNPSDPPYYIPGYPGEHDEL